MPEGWLTLGVPLWMALAVVTLGVLLLIKAPYGRHLREGWGPTISSRVGWVLMESPSVLVMGWLFLLCESPGPCTWLFLVIWQAHYIHRAWIFPFRVRGDPRQMPLLITLLGLVFNGVNTVINGAWLFLLENRSDPAWLTDPRFILGLALFAVGMSVNLVSDNHLLALRSRGHGYQVPSHPLFRHVSCPNYLGEIIEWLGWALATWSLPGLAFATWTACNLVPRSLAHHRWYQEQFSDYPVSRKALIPGLL